MAGDTSTELACTSNFVNPSGQITYAANTAIPSVSAISCSSYGGPLDYSVWPSLSTLGGNVAISRTTGIISGTVVKTPMSPLLFTVTAADSVTGYSGYFDFYASVSSGE